MADMKSIVRLMKELEDQLVVCMRCGMCQAVCPLYAQTGREADVARGKLALLDGLLKAMFDDPRGVSERLDRCLLCGSCAANCPSGVRVLDIFLKARAILTGCAGLSPAKQLVLRGMLSRPEAFDRLMEWGARFQTLFTRPVNETVGTSCARFVSPLLKERHFRPLAPVPFHREIPMLDIAPAANGPLAAVFVGCLIDKIFPSVARAAVKALRHHGAGIYLPAGQGCCGIPALSAGDTETFHRLLRHNLERFVPERFDVLLTACATCTATIREIWPVMADRHDRALQQRVAELSAKTMDISRFLVTEIGNADGAGKAAAHPDKDVQTVTVHDPCHLKKGLGVFREPRALIAAADGYRLVEMAAADACCGMGGSFNLQHYAISSRIGRLKAEAIRATGCATVATGCPACMLQLSEALSKAGDRISVRHPVEIYAETIEP